MSLGEQLTPVDGDPHALLAFLPPVGDLLGREVAVPLVKLRHGGTHASMAGTKATIVLMAGILGHLFVRRLAILEHDERTSDRLVVGREKVHNVTSSQSHLVSFHHHVTIMALF